MQARVIRGESTVTIANLGSPAQSSMTRARPGNAPAVPRSGCLSTSSRWDQDQRQGGEEGPRARQIDSLPGQEPCKRQDQGELRELGRLKAQGPDPEPPAGAVFLEAREP